MVRRGVYWTGSIGFDEGTGKSATNAVSSQSNLSPVIGRQRIHFQQHFCQFLSKSQVYFCCICQHQKPRQYRNDIKMFKAKLLHRMTQCKITDFETKLFNEKSQFNIATIATYAQNKVAYTFECQTEWAKSAYRVHHDTPDRNLILFEYIPTQHRYLSKGLAASCIWWRMNAAYGPGDTYIILLFRNTQTANWLYPVLQKVDVYGILARNPIHWNVCQPTNSYMIKLCSKHDMPSSIQLCISVVCDDACSRHWHLVCLYVTLCVCLCDKKKEIMNGSLPGVSWHRLPQSDNCHSSRTEFQAIRSSKPSNNWIATVKTLSARLIRLSPTLLRFFVAMPLPIGINRINFGRNTFPTLQILSFEIIEANLLSATVTFPWVGFGSMERSIHSQVHSSFSLSISNHSFLQFLADLCIIKKTTGLAAVNSMNFAQLLRTAVNTGQWHSGQAEMKGNVTF